jgi:hypothetical protein
LNRMEVIGIHRIYKNELYYFRINEASVPWECKGINENP